MSKPFVCASRQHPHAFTLPPPLERRARTLHVGQILPSGEIVTLRAFRALEAHADAHSRHLAEKGGRR